MNITINGKKKGGLLVGIILIIVGICLLWYNEGRTIKTKNSIIEAQKKYVEIESDKVLAENDGKVIYTHGNLIFDENGSSDNLFKVNVNSAVLKRTVEMYQWVEECDTDSDGNETCSYSKEWSEELIDSSSFSNTSYSNPTSKKYDSSKFYANTIKLDAFDIKYFNDSLSTNQKYYDLSLDVANSYGLNISDNYYTTVASDSDAKIGDIRISFSYNNAKELSIIGLQSDNRIVSYTASNGYSVSAMEESYVTADKLFQNLFDNNNILKWILRGFGTLLVICGSLAIIAPIQKLANYIPILGTIFNTATSFVMILIGIAISLLVIAIAWFRFRPILSIILIAIIILIFVLINILKKKNNNINNIKNI